MKNMNAEEQKIGWDMIERRIKKAGDKGNTSVEKYKKTGWGSLFGWLRLKEEQNVEND